MNVVIISKEKYEEMVGKLNRLSDRVNEIIGKREEGKLSRANAPRQRDASLLPNRAQDFLQAGGCSKYCPTRGGQTQGCRMAWQDNLTRRINVPLNPQ